MHMQILTAITGKEMGPNDLARELPADVLVKLKKIDSRDNANFHFQFLFYTMWDHLEMAAKLEWMTPFLTKSAERAIECGFYSPTAQMRKLVSKRNAQFDTLFEKIQSKLTHNCFNPKCTFKMAEASMLVKCENCQSAKYCSKECQLVHWKKDHWKNCVKRPEHEIGIFRDFKR